MNFYTLVKDNGYRGGGRWFLRIAEEHEILAGDVKLFEGDSAMEAARLTVVDEDSAVYGWNIEKPSYGDTARFVPYKGCKGAAVISSALEQAPSDAKQAFAEYLAGRWYDGTVNLEKSGLDLSVYDTKTRGFYKQHTLRDVLRKSAFGESCPDAICEVIDRIKANMLAHPATTRQIDALGKVLLGQKADYDKDKDPADSIIAQIVDPIFDHSRWGDRSKVHTIVHAPEPRLVYAVKRYILKEVNHKEPHKCWYYWNVMPLAWMMKHRKSGFETSPIAYAIYDTFYNSNPTAVETTMIPLWKLLNPEAKKLMTIPVVKNGTKKR